LADSLRQAIEALGSIKPREAKAAEEFARPLVEAIVGLDEALGRAQQTMDAARRRIADETPRQAREALDTALAEQPWWRRSLARSLRPLVQRICLDEPAAQNRQVLDSLAEGWSLIISRLRRTMRQAEIERVQCVGELADPTRMIVIEAVQDPSRRPGEVVAEARPGYLFRGQVFRFAEVTAVAAARFEPEESDGPPAY
jgi:molecular chaperone GrpE (heat shock protein)